ncbi:MAG: patatin-like phospholipase family protein [Myxococcota bacterium]
MTVGLVLSGGGARGAYEVGALSFIAEAMPDLLERVKVLAGVSVGAINAVFLASRGLTPESVRELVGIWKSLDIEEFLTVSRFGAARMVGAASLRFLGQRRKSPTSSLLSVERIARVVAENTDWRGLHRRIRHGRFRAVVVAATEVASGSTHLFIEGQEPSKDRGSPTSIRRHGMLGPSHVLASAAIPFFFPPVEIGGLWYVDGGLRHNTPLSPAIQLGADRLLLITVRSQNPVSAATEGFPGLGQVLGKVLDSVFLDRVSFDVDRLYTMNEILGAVEAIGPEALSRFRSELVARGLPPYNRIPFAVIRPRGDLGVIAAEHLARVEAKGPSSLLRVLRALFEDDSGATADAASFFLFDGQFASTLIDEGWRDASEHRAELLRLLA